jgi:hypothetical protein
MEKPTSEEIKKFIDVFDRLCKFEADHRNVRKWGCFKDDEVPIPEVVKVSSWLRSKVEITEKDKFESLLTKYEDKADEIHIKMNTARQSNDYIEYDSLEEEATIYEKVIDDLKKLGGYGELSNS